MESCQGARFLQDPRAGMFLLPFPAFPVCSHSGGSRAGWREQLHIPDPALDLPHQPRIGIIWKKGKGWISPQESLRNPSEEEEDLEGLQGERSNPINLSH